MSWTSQAWSMMKREDMLVARSAAPLSKTTARLPEKSPSSSMSRSPSAR
jgi:hypothetical protein